MTPLALLCMRRPSNAALSVVILIIASSLAMAGWVPRSNSSKPLSRPRTPSISRFSSLSNSCCTLRPKDPLKSKLAIETRTMVAGPTVTSLNMKPSSSRMRQYDCFLMTRSAKFAIRTIPSVFHGMKSQTPLLELRQTSDYQDLPQHSMPAAAPCPLREQCRRAPLPATILAQSPSVVPRMAQHLVYLHQRLTTHLNACNRRRMERINQQKPSRSRSIAPAPYNDRHRLLLPPRQSPMGMAL